MEFNQDFRDMLVALNEAKVKYLVVGAYAVAAQRHQHVVVPQPDKFDERLQGVQATVDVANGEVSRHEDSRNEWRKQSDNFTREPT